jgi:hypothetical protein
MERGVITIEQSGGGFVSAFHFIWTIQHSETHSDSRGMFIFRCETRNVLLVQTLKEAKTVHFFFFFFIVTHQPNKKKGMVGGTGAI